jgi:hypothetical protein
MTIVPQAPVIPVYIKYAPTMIRMANTIATPPITFKAIPARNLLLTSSEPAKTTTSPTTILTIPQRKIRIPLPVKRQNPTELV